MKLGFQCGGLLILLSVVFSSFPATVQIGQNFTGSTFGTDSSALPPDTTGVIGPDHFVEFLNGRFAVYDRNTGKRVMSRTDVSFWTNAGVTIGRSTTVTDPRLVFDVDSGRWFAAMVDVNTRRQRANRFLLAVSSSSDPTQAWHGVAFAAAGGLSYFADFPTLGVDTNAVYLSGDLFDLFESPAGPIIYSIPKASLLTTTPTTAGMLSSGLLDYETYGDIVQPAMLTGVASTPEVMLAVGDVGEDFKPHSTLVLTPLRTTNSTISLGTPVTINVPAYEIPINPAQPGEVDTLDDGDARISASVRRVGDILYATHCIQVNDRAAVRWYRIDAVQHTLIEAGTISDPELEYFYPSIAANTNGTVVLGCNGTSLNMYVSSFAFVGQVTTNVLSFGPRILLKEGLATYDTHLSEGISRWGDYSATTVDPTDPTHFWTIQAYPADPTSWATQITELIVSTPGRTEFGPALTLTHQAGSLVISWATSAGTMLQVTPSLTSPNWENVTEAPASANGVTSEVIANSGNEGFYRLVRP
jgi:hypothetical protein